MSDTGLKDETLSAHGWDFRIHADVDGWRWVVNLGTIRFGDLMLACQEGHPSQAYPTAKEARNAAVAWAAEHEREGGE